MPKRQRPSTNHGDENEDPASSTTAMHDRRHPAAARPPASLDTERVPMAAVTSMQPLFGSNVPHAPTPRRNAKRSAAQKLMDANVTAQEMIGTASMQKGVRNIRPLCPKTTIQHAGLMDFLSACLELMEPGSSAEILVDGASRILQSETWKSVARSLCRTKEEHGGRQMDGRHHVNTIVSEMSAMVHAYQRLTGLTVDKSINKCMIQYIRDDLAREFSLSDEYKEKITLSADDTTAMVEAMYRNGEREVKWVLPRQRLQFHWLLHESIFCAARPTESMVTKPYQHENDAVKWGDIRWWIVLDVDGEVRMSYDVTHRNLKGRRQAASEFKRTFFIDEGRNGMNNELYNMPPAILREHGNRLAVPMKPACLDLLILRDMERTGGTWRVSEQQGLRYANARDLLIKVGRAAGMTVVPTWYMIRRHAIDTMNAHGAQEADLRVQAGHHAGSWTFASKYLSRTSRLSLPAMIAGKQLATHSLELINGMARHVDLPTSISMQARREILMSPEVAVENDEGRRGTVIKKLTRLAYAREIVAFLHVKRDVAINLGLSGAREQQEADEITSAIAAIELPEAPAPEAPAESDTSTSLSMVASTLSWRRKEPRTDAHVGNPLWTALFEASDTGNVYPGTALIAALAQDMPPRENTLVGFHHGEDATSDGLCPVQGCQKAIKDFLNNGQFAAHVHSCALKDLATQYMDANVALLTADMECHWQRARAGVPSQSLCTYKREGKFPPVVMLMRHYYEHVRRAFRMKQPCGWKDTDKSEACGWIVEDDDLRDVRSGLRHMELEHGVLLPAPSAADVTDMPIPRASVQYCELCQTWVVGAKAAEIHARGHIVATYSDFELDGDMCATDIHGVHGKLTQAKRNALCPFCMFDTQKPYADRMSLSPTNAQHTHRHVARHLLVLDQTAAHGCPWTLLCPGESYTVVDLANHLVTAHHIALGGIKATQSATPTLVTLESLAKLSRHGS
ncbi:hypothetical protein HDU87_001193 [Geranomyces variabilis]|uniref:C2H2-type domain-containing protein n=1 Tax=Geranomyces variabilis TaxID=109894 RepID=A0AAD5XLF0_9FUNG|nr:hypothetical protein HDU87_001193 [Geranomyces variabilis]